jgi:ABC-type multidrug transport system ATPase subunit
MHEGRMIFSGSMRDMKQRLRRDDFTLELDGVPDEIQRIVEDSSRIAGIQTRLRDANTLVVEVAEGHSRARALAELLRLADSTGVSLQTISSGQNETEHAYLQLLQEDSAHGFRRFNLQGGNGNDALPGDPAA